MKKFLEVKKFYSLILFLCIISLISAIYIEYILEQKPCKLCIYQRLPYLAAIFVCFFGYNYSKNIFWLYLLTLTFILSSILSGYHVGIENNIFYESAVCTNENLNITEKSKLLESLKNQTPSCKNVNFTVFGLSLATINFMISLLVSIICVVVIKNEKNK
tara:strand:- start:1167 stop:1646 length:480 start_codon:yes stop_codon:yes gene_type:complete